MFNTIKAACRLLPPNLEHRLLRRYFRYRFPQEFASLQRYRTETSAEGHSLIPADKLKCIFIHIPKCAGISVGRSLFGSYGGWHLRAATYQIIYSPKELAHYFKFTFVRNPWDRLASAFFFLKSGGVNDIDRAFADQHLARYNDFETFVTDWVNPQNIKLYYHFQPQVYFLCTNGRLPWVDFVGFFENLAADFAFIRDRLAVKADLGFLNKTKSERGDYQSLYTDRMTQIVADVYAEDIAMLQYTFDNSSLAGQLAARNAHGFGNRNYYRDLTGNPSKRSDGLKIEIKEASTGELPRS
jgi:Sulfotransferase family